jgi:alkanesulfonate monooxygenase SsuD/methylene tetrahydromethanopterin reductase-like flavin-dependent oxidoreductase (luciferase family)
MLFGLNLPNYSSLGHRDAMIAIAERAEALGYSSLWTSDHILLPTTLPDPYGNLLESFTTLSYLAARTEHIRLATGSWCSLNATRSWSPNRRPPSTISVVAA